MTEVSHPQRQDESIHSDRGVSRLAGHLRRVEVVGEQVGEVIDETGIAARVAADVHHERVHPCRGQLRQHRVDRQLPFNERPQPQMSELDERDTGHSQMRDTCVTAR